MSDVSDSEEFYDAEESTPSKSPSKEPKEQLQEPTAEPPKPPDPEFKIPQPPPEPTRPPSNPEVRSNPPQPTKPSVTELSDGRKWFRELRQQMLTDEEDVTTNPSPPDSQTSSVEGVFAIGPSKTSHPFRIVEHDRASVHSMTSLGRVGRLLSGGTSESASSLSTANICGLVSGEKEKETSPTRKVSANSQLPMQEPDVVASTKTSSITVDVPPVAPPRRKKKRLESIPSISEQNQSVMPLPSPASTIESLTRELENSLDIQTVTKGQYVVKPQDEEKAKAEGPFSRPSVSITSEGIFGPLSSNSIGRTSINSAIGLSMAHFTGTGSSFGSNESSNGGSSGEAKRLKVSPRSSNERRRSFGDDPASHQLNMFVRTRTDSGKQLSDIEILEQVTVLNLDTGERVPLSIAEEKLPQGINPLSLHIMRLTSEYVSNSSLQEKESDEESVDSKMSEAVLGKIIEPGLMRKKRAEKLKKFLGTTVRKTMDKAKSIAQEVSHGRHKNEEVLDLVDEVSPPGEACKLKVSNSHKGPYDFDALQQVQDLSGLHQGPVWCMKFSACGRLLATAGQDRVLRVWVLRSAYQHFQDMRTKYTAETVSPTPSQESLVSQHSMPLPEEEPSAASAAGPFMPQPFCTFSGHTSDLLDLSWSKNYFILSSSMDKTVRLWHISRKECLCCFQHIDFVTAIVFHPRDDRYFLSGSLDGKLRLWNIPDKKVAVWNEVDGLAKLITAANFCQNGKFAVVGSYDGRCIFYNTEQLKYHTTIHVRSSRGRNATGRKISGIEPMPGEDKILITSNDSRIRLYDLRDLSLTCKYKGYVNVSSQIKASFSHDGKYILSGSENQYLYIWKTHHDFFKFSSARRDRNDFWEGVKAHNAVVTCAVFSPQPKLILEEVEKLEAERLVVPNERNLPSSSATHNSNDGYAFVSADFNGCIKVFINRMKLKHSSLPASALA